MTQETPVPRLDLAPKLKRPLSLWNPLDYLRLLYWVFYFPQALRWYLDSFGGGYIPQGEMNWWKGWKLLQENIVQRNLFLQGLLLTIITSLVISGILQSISVSIVWSGVGFGIAVGVASGITFGLFFGVSKGVIFSVVTGVFVGLGGFVETTSVLFDGMALGIFFGMLSSLLVASVIVAVVSIVVFSLFVSIVFCIGIGTVFYVAGYIEENLLTGIAFGLAMGLTVIHPESWLIGLSFNIRYLQKCSLIFLRITSLPIPYLSPCLKKWLQQDWESGLYNVNQLLAYTLQFIPVVNAVNYALSKIPHEQIIYRISQVAEQSFNWELIR